MKKLLVSLVCIVALLAIPISGCAVEPTTPTAPEKATYNWIFGAPWVEGQAKYEYALDWIDRIEEASDGRMQVEFYAGDLLGDYTVQSQNVSVGKQDFFYSSPSSVNSERWNAKQLAFTEYKADLDKLWELFGPGGWVYDFYADVSENDCNWHVDALLLEGFTGMVSNVKFEPVPEGPQGLKCRIMASETWRLVAGALGFNAVTLPWGELHSGLMLGTVDCAFGSTGVDDYVMFADVVDYAILYNTHFGCIIHGMNKDLYDSLSLEDQGIIDQVSSEWARIVWGEWQEYEDAEWAKLRASGQYKEIIELTPEQWWACAEAVRPVVWPYLENIMGKQTMDKVRAGAVQWPITD